MGEKCGGGRFILYPSPLQVDPLRKSTFVKVYENDVSPFSQHPLPRPFSTKSVYGNYVTRFVIVERNNVPRKGYFSAFFFFLKNGFIIFESWGGG